MFAGQDRYDWIREQYEKSRRREYLALAIGLFSIIIWATISLIPSYATLSQEIRDFVSLFILVTLLAALGVYGSSDKLLPPMEDRALYRLKSVFVNLQAYSSHGDEAYKEKAVRDLAKFADVLDAWEWGNLKFIQDGIGNAIAEFRKNIRGALIPAVKSTDRTTAQSFLMSLTHVENAIQMGQLDKEHFDRWNQHWLSRFQYHKPRPGLLKMVGSKKLQLVGIAVLVASPLVTWYIALDISHTSVDTAFSGGAIVFAGVLAALVALGVLTLGRQKPSVKVRSSLKENLDPELGSP